MMYNGRMEKKRTNLELRDAIQATLEGRYAELADEWLKPALALFVPDDDALRFYHALARLGRQCLRPQGRVYVELNEALGEETADVFRRAGYTAVELRRDQFGRTRMLRAVLPSKLSMKQ